MSKFTHLLHVVKFRNAAKCSACQGTLTRKPSFKLHEYGVIIRKIGFEFLITSSTKFLIFPNIRILHEVLIM